MINTKQYSKKHEFNEEVLNIAFSDMSLNSGKNNIIVQKITHLLDSMGGKNKISFGSSGVLFEQFCHSCCHALAEHLIYTLHDEDGFQVSHVQIISSMTIHSCIEITWKGTRYYLDAEGIFTSLEDILERYKADGINVDSLEIVKRQSDCIVDEGDNEEVRKLTELTKIWEVVTLIGEEEEVNSIGDLEENAMDNITIAILNNA